jgi:DNA-binding CsgD family transcriptional regulator
MRPQLGWSTMAAGNRQTAGCAMVGTSSIRTAIAGTASTIDVGDGHVVVREGCRGDEAFVLVSGAAEVLVGGRPVAQLEEGDLFGEIATIDGGPRTATVVTTAPSRLAVLDRPAMQDLLRRPEVGMGVAARLAGWLRRAQVPNEAAHAWSTLTASERNVAGLVAEGLTNRQIGARLCVSSYTVDSHLRHSFSKLGISSRVELAALAVRAGVPAAAG